MLGYKLVLFICNLKYLLLVFLIILGRFVSCRFWKRLSIFKLSSGHLERFFIKDRILTCLWLFSFRVKLRHVMTKTNGGALILPVLHLSMVILRSCQCLSNYRWQEVIVTHLFDFLYLWVVLVFFLICAVYATDRHWKCDQFLTICVLTIRSLRSHRWFSFLPFWHVPGSFRWLSHSGWTLWFGRILNFTGRWSPRLRWLLRLRAKDWSLVFGDDLFCSVLSLLLLHCLEHFAFDTDCVRWELLFILAIYCAAIAS